MTDTQRTSDPMGFMDDEMYQGLRALEPMQAKRMTLETGTVLVVMREETYKYLVSKAGMKAVYPEEQ
jgi:hypothetical protein